MITDSAVYAYLTSSVLKYDTNNGHHSFFLISAQVEVVWQKNNFFYFKALLTIWLGVYGVIAVASIPLLSICISYFQTHGGECAFYFLFFILIRLKCLMLFCLSICLSVCLTIFVLFCVFVSDRHRQLCNDRPFLKKIWWPLTPLSPMYHMKQALW